MQPSTLEAKSTHQQTATKEEFIFCLQLNNGKIVVGKATNPCRRIASINSGLNPYVKGALQVNRILGIKEVTAERNLPSVVARFCDKYGSDKVIAV